MTNVYYYLRGDEELLDGDWIKPTLFSLKESEGDTSTQTIKGRIIHCIFKHTCRNNKMFFNLSHESNPMKH